MMSQADISAGTSGMMKLRASTKKMVKEEIKENLKATVYADVGHRS